MKKIKKKILVVNQEEYNKENQKENHKKIHKEKIK
jgi:hypothetical protein